MNTSDNMRLFYDKVHKMNSSRIGWIAVWLTTLIGIPLCGLSSKENSLSLFYTICAILLFLTASINYVKKYLGLSADDSTEISFISLASPGSDFADIMRVHAFDTAAYFRVLMLRFIPMQIFSVVCIAVPALMGLTDKKAMPVLIAAVVILPHLVMLISSLAFRHSLSHESGSVSLIFSGVISGLYTLISFLGYELYLAFLVLTVIAVTADKGMLAGIDETEIASVASHYDFFMYIALISAMAFGYFLNNSMSVNKTARRLHRTLTVISALLMITGIVAYTGLCKNNNVTLRPDSFRLTENGVSREYELGDVESFRVYASEDNRILTDISFSDGKKITLFKYSCSDTPAWSAAYFSDYNYAAELIGKLTALGINGRLEDRDRLYENVHTSYDPRCAEGYDQIEAIMK
ncbi:MAG: hypothetical protein K5686_08520 [Lachnospiraceae bacterium]|nr:hypothetical protein [Lachnospiraceae bacterium]